MNPKLSIAAALVGLLAFSACGDSKAGDSTKTTTSYGTKKDYTYEEREAFQADMERAITKLEVRAAELRAKAAESGQELKAETRELIDDIEAKLPTLKRNLAEARDATREGWDDFKRKFHDAFDDLDKRIERAFS